VFSLWVQPSDLFLVLFALDTCRRQSSADLDHAAVKVHFGPPKREQFAYPRSRVDCGLDLLALGALLSGCVQTQQFTPSAAPARYQQHGLTANIVEVQVNNLRPEQSAGDALSQVLKAQLVASLSPDPAPAATTHCQLTVDVIEPRAFFTLGNWNASTRFRARLFEASGKALGQWEATGSARRSNMFGYVTAQAVSQDLYNIAVADLLSSLTPVSARH